MKYCKVDKNKKEEVKTIIYKLRKQGLVYRVIAEEIEKNGIEISYITVRRICKEMFETKDEKEPNFKKNKVKLDCELIYILREQGLTYKDIVEKLQEQGVNVSVTTVSFRCKEIYNSKGEKEPDWEERVKLDDELIYDLREKGLVYSKITEELERHGIYISDSTVRKRCKEIYNIKGKNEPVTKIDRLEINEELIYNLREQGLTYKEIVEEMKKQGIDISETTVRKRCKDIYNIRGEKEPKIDSKKRKLTEQDLGSVHYDKELNVVKRDRSLIQQRNEKIYNLRKKGWNCQRIANNIGVSISSVSRVCKKMDDLKGDKAQYIKTRNHNNISDESKALEETIYKLREEGLSYKEILDKVRVCSSITTKQGVAQRYKKAFKHNEEQLAKIILNLVVTRKATIDQIQKMAEYYGVDLEKTINSLEER